MKKLSLLFITVLLLFSTCAIAQEAELLDAYLEDLASNNITQPQYSDSIVGHSVDIVVDENSQSHEVIRPNAVEYRRIESANGKEIYQEVPIQFANQNLETTSVTVSEVADAQNSQELEVIELEPEEGSVKVIEAPENQPTGSVGNGRIGVKKGTLNSKRSFCEQNRYARECVLSKYLILCREDPTSSDCKGELEKFDRFCGTFPNAYKCKKAKIAMACQKNPQTDACKTFNQRYCEKFPKAVFCNYN
jgi:hypothetical protein